MSKKILINQTGDNPTKFLTNPASTPTSIHTDTNQLAGVTKAELDAAIADVRPYKVYTALLTQTGTDAPVATVLENTLGGTPIWTRGLAGEYNCTLNGVFVQEKTLVFVSNVFPSLADAVIIKASTDSTDNFITLSARDLTDSEMEMEADLGSVFLEIRVYN